MKSKKAALVFNWTLTIMVIAILAWALIQFTSKYSRYENLGKKQLNIFQTYAKAESILLFIDQSAKYALQQAIYELAKNGGIPDAYDTEYIDTSGTAYSGESDDISIKSCGKFNDASIWYEIKKESGKYQDALCFDENSVNTNLQNVFNKNLNKYLLLHPSNILLDNYDYEIKDGLEIIGRALNPLKFDILKDEAKESIKESSITPDGFIDFTGTELCKKGARCLSTKEAYELLSKAQEIAKNKGTSLEVTKGYRTLQEQKEEWKIRPDSRYVCPPTSKCPHLTGNAADVRLKDKTSDIMTKKDWMLLHDIMTQAGWVRYANEPWHFECCGTVRYARAKEQGVTAIV